MIKERIKAQASPDRFIDPNFPAQNAFVTDKSRFIAAQCSRRAGKSNGLAIRFLRTLEKHPGALCPYIALTRESARNIMWPALMEQDAKFQIGCTFTESNLTMTHPNGARVQLFGADMKNFIRRLKGLKTPGVGLDEVQDMPTHITSLVDDVLTPALTDYPNSWLALTGTPGPVPLGYFYEVTELRKYGYSVHKWTLLDNPYLPNAARFINELKIKRGWDDQNPTLRREWLNQWVLDLETLLVRYNEGTNHYNQLPTAHWEYILGIDIGYNDADALAVLAWSEAQDATYLVEEVIANKQGISELVASINYLSNKYDFSKMVIDEGGLGKKIAEEIRRRHHIPVQAADKMRKMENVEFLNDSLRTGRFKAKKDSRFAEDSYRLQIDWDKSTPDRLIVKDSYHSDIIDAVLYAFKESSAWNYEKPAVAPKYGSPEWAEQQVTDMERQALEHFQAQEEAEKGFGINWGDI